MKVRGSYLITSAEFAESCLSELERLKENGASALRIFKMSEE
jgi:hypothetical protein